MNWKRYSFSFFFLFLFLFPLTEKAIHDFRHQDDTHCISNAKHLHPLEHSCSLCDYTLSSSASLPDAVPAFQSFSFHFSYSEYKESLSLISTDFRFSPRGPPVFS